MTDDLKQLAGFDIRSAAHQGDCCANYTENPTQQINKQTMANLIYNKKTSESCNVRRKLEVLALKLNLSDSTICVQLNILPRRPDVVLSYQETGSCFKSLPIPHDENCHSVAKRCAQPV